MNQERIYGLHAGWHDNELIGKFIIGSDRKQDVFAFAYDDRWLENHPDFLLDPDIFPFPGRQYAPNGLFSFLEDASPDRWGRELLKRREQNEADKEGRVPKELTTQDFLLGVEDSIRMGGIRISDGNGYVANKNTKIPPATSLRALEDSAHKFEKAGAILQDTELQSLISVGSSLGGARPKVNVIDEKGDLWIAKFQSDRDQAQTESWEFVTHELGVLCGLHMAEGRLEQLGSRSCYLTKRFDREKEKRIHFASAMTMLHKKDGDDASFLELAECISSISAEAKADLQELWRRIVFGVIVNNTDCHLRNHGFILTEKGWRLSPAYDINPNPMGKLLAISVDDTRRIPDLDVVMDTAIYYGIEQPKDEITRMKSIVAKAYIPLAQKVRIPRNEIVQMGRFMGGDVANKRI